jgi:hypothetical protein
VNTRSVLTNWMTIPEDTTPEIADGNSMAYRLFRKAVQQGRSERRGESYSVPYVEPLSDARTMLAGFFNNLLGIISAFGRQGDRCQPLVETVKLFGRKDFVL